MFLQVSVCPWGGGGCVVAWGACVVAPGGWGRVWLLPGGMRGFFDEIRSMSGRYASYWNAFLFCVLFQEAATYRMNRSVLRNTQLMTAGQVLTLRHLSTTHRKLKQAARIFYRRPTRRRQSSTICVNKPRAMQIQYLLSRRRTTPG